MIHEPQSDCTACTQLLLNLSQIKEDAGGLSEATNFGYSSNLGTWLCSHAYLNHIQNAYGGVVDFVAAQQSWPNNDYPDCSYSYNWRPYAVTQRTETDLASGRSNVWTYDGSGWNDDAYGFSKVWVSRPGDDGGQRSTIISRRK